MWRVIVLGVIQSILLCSAQVMLKLAMSKIEVFKFTWNFILSQLTNWWLLGSGISFLSGSLLWFYMLKNFPFGVVYPITSLSYLFGLIAALLVFNENVSVLQWIGVFLIMSGCVLIVK